MIYLLCYNSCLSMFRNLSFLKENKRKQAPRRKEIKENEPLRKDNPPYTNNS